MKIKLLSALSILTVCQFMPDLVRAQSFMNLDFESATGPNGNQPGLFPVTTALPGWSLYYGTNQQSQINFDDISTGSTQVTLVGQNDPDGPNAIEGNYGLYFQGGATATDASIRQTGLIPVGTMSIEFKANGDITYGPILLTFGSQNISVYVLSSGPNYTLYGGDVSGLAGTSGQLEFSVPGYSEGYTFNAWSLDSIIFSTSPVPEPRTCALIVGGVILFGFNRTSRANQYRKRANEKRFGAGTASRR